MLQYGEQVNISMLPKVQFPTGLRFSSLIQIVYVDYDSLPALQVYIGYSEGKEHC